MSDDASTLSRKPRLIWPWVVGGLLVILVCAAVPVMRFGLRFRESSLKGMTPSEVLARCGPPTFALTAGGTGPTDDVPGEPWWEGMGEDARAALVAKPEFTFAYSSSWGDRVAVRFKNGRVVRVTNTPK